MLRNSSKNRRYKLELIKILVIHIYRICLNEEIMIKELNLLGIILTNNGYPPHIIKSSISDEEILISKCLTPRKMKLETKTLFSLQ